MELLSSSIDAISNYASNMALNTTSDEMLISSLKVFVNYVTKPVNISFEIAK